MMLMNITSLALAALTGAAPHPTAVPAERPVAAVGDSVLTVEVLKNMTNFWTLFVKEPDSIKTTARKASAKPLTLTLDLGSAGQPEMQLPGVVDIGVMAAKYPSIAAHLKQSNLTAEQWDQYRGELLTAWFTQQSAKQNSATPTPTSLTGKNVAFLNSHDKEFTALKGSGMWFPPLPQAGGGGMGGGADLDP